MPYLILLLLKFTSYSRIKHVIFPSKESWEKTQKNAIAICIHAFMRLSLIWLSYDITWGAVGFI